MKEILRSILSQKISIPFEAHEWKTENLPISIRLWHVLQIFDCRKLGDLHGKSYKEIFNMKDCGRKTILELRDFIVQLQSADSVRHLSNLIEIGKIEKKEKRQSETIYIPQESRGLPLSSFPFSTRLTNVFLNSDFRLLGDLHGFPLNKLKTLRNCGLDTILELKDFVGKIQKGQFQMEPTLTEIAITPTNLNLAQLIEFIDNFLAEFSPRDQDILGLRFGATSGKPLTLEEIGGRYELTRERVRQIESRAVKKLKFRLGQAGDRLFGQLHRDCLAAVCPLTPDLLVYWAEKDASDFCFSPSFYLKLLAELAPDIPALVEGQISQGQPRNERYSKISQAIKEMVRQHYAPVSLVKVFEQLRNSISDLNEKDFLDALEFSNNLALSFDVPDKPAIKFTAKRKAQEIVFQILSESERPLTPEEIIAVATESFGEEFTTSSPRSLNNLLYYAEGFYLLDSRAIGLRKHFRLPPEKWNELQNDFFKLLKENNRSFSTSEVIGRELFSWAKIINSSEAAEILREDNRFTDLGRFHFALAEWEVEEREMVTDLIVRVLRQAKHPLASTDIGSRIQNFRSITPTSMSSILRQHKAVKDYGFGFYGLKEWKDAYREFLVSNKAFVNRAVARSEPPLTFGDLCRKLEIAEIGTLADKLWRILRALSKLRLKPNNQSPETILVHMNWRFDRAIQRVLAQSERPLSAYEIQWELNRVFGTTFDEKNLDSIRNCLQNDDLFVRNLQGAFLLNEQLEQSDFDAEWLRYACFEILKEENAVLSADDLLEKLEAEDLASDIFSAEMLAVLLRGDALFQEIGMNLFRAKK